MSDEHQVSSVDNFLSIPEEDGGNGQVYLSQPAPSIQGSSDGQQWESGVSNGRVVVGTENPLPSNPALHQQGSTPVVPSSVSTSTAGGRTAFPERVPLPGDNGPPGLRPPRLAYPAPQQEMPSSPTPHFPVAEESWADQASPAFAPVEESGASNDVPESQDDVTGTNGDITEENNAIDNGNGWPQESPQNGEDEDYISVRKKKLMDDNRQLNDEMNCTVCREEKRAFLILPCGHLCVCVNCAAYLAYINAACPICRGPIETYLKPKLACFADVRPVTP